jgi:hypothetical protein
MTQPPGAPRSARREVITADCRIFESARIDRSAAIFPAIAKDATIPKAQIEFGAAFGA